MYTTVSAQSWRADKRRVNARASWYCRARVCDVGTNDLSAAIRPRRRRMASSVDRIAASDASATNSSKAGSSMLLSVAACSSRAASSLAGAFDRSDSNPATKSSRASSRLFTSSMSSYLSRNGKSLRRAALKTRAPSAPSNSAFDVMFESVPEMFNILGRKVLR